MALSYIEMFYFSFRLIMSSPWKRFSAVHVKEMRQGGEIELKFREDSELSWVAANCCDHLQWGNLFNNPVADLLKGHYIHVHVLAESIMTFFTIIYDHLDVALQRIVHCLSYACADLCGRNNDNEGQLAKWKIPGWRIQTDCHCVKAMYIIYEKQQFVFELNSRHLYQKSILGSMYLKYIAITGSASTPRPMWWHKQCLASRSKKTTRTWDRVWVTFSDWLSEHPQFQPWVNQARGSTGDCNLISGAIRSQTAGSIP